MQTNFTCAYEHHKNTAAYFVVILVAALVSGCSDTTNLSNDSINSYSDFEEEFAKLLTANNIEYRYSEKGEIVLSEEDLDAASKLRSRLQARLDTSKGKGDSIRPGSHEIFLCITNLLNVEKKYEYNVSVTNGIEWITFPNGGPNDEYSLHIAETCMDARTSS